MTLLSESLCREIFNGQQLQQAEPSWLRLRGANGLDIPYTGYVLANFQLQGVAVPAKGVVVAKDHCLGQHGALLGTNVTSACWEELLKKGPASPRLPSNAAFEWDHIFADCRRIHHAKVQQGRQDAAGVACRYALTLPVNSEALLCARVPTGHYWPQGWVVLVTIRLRLLHYWLSVSL